MRSTIRTIKKKTAKTKITGSIKNATGKEVGSVIPKNKTQTINVRARKDISLSIIIDNYTFERHFKNNKIPCALIRTRHFEGYLLWRLGR